jgi:hypothetical protein
MWFRTEEQIADIAKTRRGETVHTARRQELGFEPIDLDKYIYEVKQMDRMLESATLKIR